MIVAHPEIDNSTTQQFFKEGLAGFDNYEWHEIKQEFEVASERLLLIKADRIVFQFPLYWYSAPAILKQWLDEVFSVNQLDLSGKELGLVVSTGSPSKDFQAGGTEKYAMSEVLRPYEMLANRMGMKYLTPVVIHQFAYLKETDKQQLLVRYQQYVTNEQFASFNGQVNWFVKGLNERVADNPEVAKLLSVLEENEEQRHDLSWNVEQFKQDED
ncbi:hypothetical protein FC70_GL001147 [Paucilactobacillus oligofermentans DSM 15707 = LMG 22743]|uniref:Flavodoxin-like fold domain-containing protein n=1 Tax=Paucilactobacillus oligofermentans DSM 15707 = LMG 22743 TaxID=1423778 RepID=A0A0R1RLL4_9LACO|nr:hypothetical protein FC70_GL001147 [Paucilactobacillus oligofermentans DSM 15707 = LMG 22743]